jgi:hypothetical protein
MGIISGIAGGTVISGNVTGAVQPAGFIMLGNPIWAGGYIGGVQLAAALLAFIIAGFGYRAWKVTENDAYKYFCIAFALMSAGLFAESAWLMLPFGQLGWLEFAPLASDVCFSMFMFFSALAYSLLFWVYARDRLDKPGSNGKNTWVPAVLTTTGMTSSTPASGVYITLHHIFNIVSVGLLAYPLIRTYGNLRDKRSLLSALPFVGFGFLILYNVFYIIAFVFPYGTGYYAGFAGGVSFSPMEEFSMFVSQSLNLAAYAAEFLGFVAFLLLFVVVQIKGEKPGAAR